MSEIDFNAVPLHTVGTYIAEKMRWRLDQYHPILVFVDKDEKDLMMSGSHARFFALLLQQNETFTRAIAHHRAQTRQDPCWENDVELWSVLGDGDTDWPQVGASLCSRMHGCVTYLESHEQRKNMEESTPAKSLQK